MVVRRRRVAAAAAVAAGGGSTTQLISAEQGTPYGDGAGNDCDVDRFYDAANDIILNRIAPQQADQDFDIVYEADLPSTFDGWPATAAVELWNYVSDAVNAGVAIVEIIDTDGVSQVAGLPAREQNAALAITTINGADLTGTYEASGRFRIRVKADGDAGDLAYIGPVRLTWALG